MIVLVGTYTGLRSIIDHPRTWIKTEFFFRDGVIQAFIAFSKETCQRPGVDPLVDFANTSSAGKDIPMCLAREQRVEFEALEMNNVLVGGWQRPKLKYFSLLKWGSARNWG